MKKADEKDRQLNGDLSRGAEVAQKAAGYQQPAGIEQQERAVFFPAQQDAKQEKSFADKGCRTGSRKRLKYGFGQHGLNEEKRELVEDGEEGCAREDTLSPKARR